MTVYLDCNATTPTNLEVAQTVMDFLVDEYGNAGSRTHEFGARAKSAVERAREEIATALGAMPDEVVFTSGATESNNIALLGLEDHGREVGRTHIISTEVEHKAILEPLGELARSGFDVEIVPVNGSGVVDIDAIARCLRPNTLLVSVMHVNNETGVIQPLAEIADLLQDHPAYFHTDAAQGFGKEPEYLLLDRIDMISISGHKIYAPKGVGALVTRRRGYERPPIRPLVHGGGQERGLRPGTLPVALIAGLGKTSELARSERRARRIAVQDFRSQVLKALEPLGPELNGDPERTIPSTLNFSIPGVDAEAAMVALKGVVAVSNGSACTSSSYQPSHVLKAMGLCPQRIAGAMRFSWSHLTPEPDWELLTSRLAALRG